MTTPTHAICVSAATCDSKAVSPTGKCKYTRPVRGWPARMGIHSINKDDYDSNDKPNRTIFCWYRPATVEEIAAARLRGEI